MHELFMYLFTKSNQKPQKKGEKKKSHLAIIFHLASFVSSLIFFFRSTLLFFQVYC